MKHQLEIYTGTPGDDDQGGQFPTTWSKSQTVWGNITPVNASRAQIFGLTMTNKPHEIDLYYFSGYIPTEDDYLIIKSTGQKLFVHSVLNVDMDYGMCKVLAIEKK